jgi:hypothetical protein
MWKVVMVTSYRIVRLTVILHIRLSSRFDHRALLMKYRCINFTSQAVCYFGDD